MSGRPQRRKRRGAGPFHPANRNKAAGPERRASRCAGAGMPRRHDRVCQRLFPWFSESGRPAPEEAPRRERRRGCRQGRRRGADPLDTGLIARRGYPEIADWGVPAKQYGRGAGARPMDAAEDIAAAYANTVYLESGFRSDCGGVLRPYVERGYVPGRQQGLAPGFCLQTVSRLPQRRRPV